MSSDHQHSSKFCGLCAVAFVNMALICYFGAASNVLVGLKVLISTNLIEQYKCDHHPGSTLKN